MSKRAHFAETITDLMDTDDRPVLILGDIGVFSFRGVFQKHPARCYNAGVCEQAMIGMAAGLAMSGFYPVISTIESFLLRRAYEFIRLDFSVQKLAGLFVGIGGAKEYSRLGPTHMCPEGEVLAKNAGLQWLDPSAAFVDFALRRFVKQRALAYVRLEE